MRKILILDDDKERHKVFRFKLSTAILSHARTFSEFIEKLRNNKYDLIFLDHDLNDFPDAESKDHIGHITGYDAAKVILLQDKKNYPATIVVHSANPWGAERIKNVLSLSGIVVYTEVFPCTELLSRKIL